MDLLALLKEYPNETWDWYEISWNPNLTLEIVEMYFYPTMKTKPFRSWSWSGLSKCPNITLEDIKLRID